MVTVISCDPLLAGYIDREVKGGGGGLVPPFLTNYMAAIWYKIMKGGYMPAPFRWASQMSSLGVRAWEDQGRGVGRQGWWMRREQGCTE